MENVKVFLVCLRKDDAITTWSESLNTSIEEVINKIKHDKNWIGGEFLEVTIEFDSNGKHCKYRLDTENTPFNLLLGS